ARLFTKGKLFASTRDRAYRNQPFQSPNIEEQTMPGKDLKQLLERIHTRLDESFVGIGAQVSDLPAVDLAELLNELTLAEAATVVSMLPIARAVELCDQ